MTSLSAHRVSYYYDTDVGNFYYAQGHPMKPYRVRMTHNLLLSYGMLDRMDILVRYSSCWMSGLRGRRCGGEFVVPWGGFLQLPSDTPVWTDLAATAAVTMCLPHRSPSTVLPRVCLSCVASVFVLCFFADAASSVGAGHDQVPR